MLRPPVVLVVTDAGIVTSAVPLNLNVTACDGTKFMPVILTVWPIMPLLVSSEIVGAVLIVKSAVGVFVPSVAEIMFSAAADDGTIKDATNPPVALDVTAATGVSVVALSLNVIACVGTKLSPATLTV